MKKHHKVTINAISDKTLSIKIDDRTYKFNLSEISVKLVNASNIEREKYEISPSGYGIHWPQIDEDLSIDGLLGIKHVPIKKKTFKPELLLLF